MKHLIVFRLAEEKWCCKRQKRAQRSWMGSWKGCWSWWVWGLRWLSWGIHSASFISTQQLSMSWSVLSWCHSFPENFFCLAPLDKSCFNLQMHWPSDLQKHSVPYPENDLQMVIQFGYVTLFASACPLAAFLAIISNTFEIRSDLFKLCFLTRRPRPDCAAGIGIGWMHVLDGLSFAAVLTNCLIIGCSSEQMHFWFPSLFNIDSARRSLEVTRIILSSSIVFQACTPFPPISAQSHENLLTLTLVSWKLVTVIYKSSSPFLHPPIEQELADVFLNVGPTDLIACINHFWKSERRSNRFQEWTCAGSIFLHDTIFMHDKS